MFAYQLSLNFITYFISSGCVCILFRVNWPAVKCSKNMSANNVQLGQIQVTRWRNNDIPFERRHSLFIYERFNSHFECALMKNVSLLLGHGILPLEVPADLAGAFLLQTLVNCTGSSAAAVATNTVANASDECQLRSSSQMRLVGPVRDVIIRPAKHAYSPSEKGENHILFKNQK